MAGLNPDARVIDISHEIPPFDITGAAYLLGTSYREFPRGTIHLAVVDPGVGTARKAIAIETKDYFFVGPDNGQFSFIARREISRIIHLTSPKYFSPRASATFHARDIFGPAAGYLSLGIEISQLGRRLAAFKSLPPAKCQRRGNEILGKIIYIDHFGNLVMSIKEENLSTRKVSVWLENRNIGTLRKTFGDVPKGALVAYINSFGHLEIGANRGSAAEILGITRQNPATISIAVRADKR